MANLDGISEQESGNDWCMNIGNECIDYKDESSCWVFVAILAPISWNSTVVPHAIPETSCIQRLESTSYHEIRFYQSTCGVHGNKLHSIISS